MNKQDIFNLTSPSKNMPSSTFDNLMKNVKLSTHSENEISFEANFNNYEIFFGMNDDDFYIEYFGFNRNGWVELEPNEEQREQMEILLRSVPPIEQEQENEYIDPYYENGVNRSDFY